MPTTPTKAKKLLKSGRAKIVGRDPFTIQLLYGIRGYTQLVTLGIDAGYEHIGYSVVTEKEELIGGEFKLLEDVSERITERRGYRRQRRNRKRHRKSRFNNRRRKEGWLAPSIQHKFDAHIKLVERLHTRLPIKKIVVEVAKFDIQKIKNPDIKRHQYQQGEQFGYYNLVAYIRHRDEYQCQNPNCKNKASEKILQIHHIGFWKGDRSNRPGNLITLCDKCHSPANHKRGKFLHGWQPQVKSFRPETFMSIIYRRLVEVLGCERRTFSCKVGSASITTRDSFEAADNSKEADPILRKSFETFGYITKYQREELGLPKSHHNDAFVIAGGTTQVMCNPLNLEQNRRNRRSLEQFYDAKYIDIRTGEKLAGSVLFSGRRTRNKNLNGENLRVYRGQKVSSGRCSIRKGRYPYQQHDLVLFQGIKYKVRGMQNLGTRVALYDAPKSTLDVKQVQSCKWRKGIVASL